MTWIHGLFVAAILALGAGGSNTTPKATSPLGETGVCELDTGAPVEENAVNCFQECGTDSACRACCICLNRGGDPARCPCQ